MATLGIRCSNNDYTFVILTGTQQKPRVRNKGNFSFPKGYGRAHSLKWFIQELEDLLKQNKIFAIGIKGTEQPAKKGKSFEERVENEAMIFLAAANFGIKHVVRKVKSTIAKDLGLKGKGKYLTTKLDCTLIEGFEKETDKMKDAILVGWSMLN